MRANHDRTSVLTPDSSPNKSSEGVQEGEVAALSASMTSTRPFITTFTSTDFNMFLQITAYFPSHVVSGWVSHFAKFILVKASHVTKVPAYERLNNHVCPAVFCFFFFFLLHLIAHHLSSALLDTYIYIYTILRPFQHLLR